MLAYAFALHACFTLIIVLVNIFKVVAVNHMLRGVDKSSHLAPSIKQLFRICSTSIFFSFVFSPVLSYAFLRLFRHDKSSKKAILGFSRKISFKVFSFEIIVDLLAAVSFYSASFLLAFNKSFVLPAIGIPHILIFAVIAISLFLFSMPLFSSLNTSGSRKPLRLQLFFTVLILIFLKLSLILTRDVVFLSILVDKSVLHSNISAAITDIFRQVVVFNGTSYLQVLPFNMFVPELVCGSECSEVGFKYARKALLFSGLFLLLISTLINLVPKKSSSEIN